MQISRSWEKAWAIPATSSKKSRGPRIRSRFRCINANDEQEILELRGIGYFAKIQEPTVVLTATGEVHTNDEAQVYVHDLNLFVTVQIPEETLAVLWLGKLCEDHGYSYEWVSGQKPRLTKAREEQSYAQRTISYLLSFQGYPQILEAFRLPHRHCRICLQQVQHKREVTDWPQENWCGSLPKKPKQKIKDG